MRKILLLLPILILLFTACSNDSIIYTYQNSVYSADLEGTPPGEAKNNKVIYNLPTRNHEVTAVSLTPDGAYAAIGILARASNSRNWDGQLIIFDMRNTKVHKVYSKSDLVRLLDYPLDQASMYFISIGWVDTNSLIFHAQPQTHWREAVPSNVSVELDIRKTTINRKVYTERLRPFGISLPTHQVKNKYAHSIQNGKLTIENETVLNLPNIKFYDVIFLSQ